MPKLKPEEIETRNREIIDAARACFLRRGFHATSTDDICREAAITPGGLYHYFGSKDELIAAVIEDAAKQAVANLSALAEESANTRSSVRALQALVAQSTKDPDVEAITRLDLDIWAETLRNEKLADTTREAWRIRRGWLESLIKSGIAEGYYSEEVDPRGLANVFMIMWLGLRLGRILWREDFDPDATVKMIGLMHIGRILNHQGLRGVAGRKTANGNARSSAK